MDRDLQVATLDDGSGVLVDGSCEHADEDRDAAGRQRWPVTRPMRNDEYAPPVETVVYQGKTGTLYLLVTRRIQLCRIPSRYAAAHREGVAGERR